MGCLILFFILDFLLINMPFKVFLFFLSLLSLSICFTLVGSYEVLLTLDKEKHKVDGPIYYYLFNTLLICLLVLHIYWWVLIYRMLVKQIKARGQLGDDVRSGMRLLLMLLF